MPCRFVGGFQRFRGTNRLHLQGDLNNYLQGNGAKQPTQSSLAVTSQDI
jgi:hypothetical protein